MKPSFPKTDGSWPSVCWLSGAEQTAPVRPIRLPASSTAQSVGRNPTTIAVVQNKPEGNRMTTMIAQPTVRTKETAAVTMSQRRSSGQCC